MRLLRGELARFFARRFPRWMLLLVVVMLSGLTAAVFLRHPDSAWREMPTLIRWYGVAMAVFAYPVAASFVGAEWTSGGIATLVTWHPRRTAVFASKLVALLVGTTAVYVGVGTMWLAGCWLLATRGAGHSPVTHELIESLAVSGVRGLGLTVFAAAVGYTVASVGRGTAAALGVAAGYVIVGEVGARTILTTWQVSTPQRFLLASYLERWLTTPYGSEWLTAAAVLATVAATLVVVAAVVFQRRDLA